MYIVYEFCNQGSLEDLLLREKTLKEAEALRIFEQLLSGFQVVKAE